MNQPHFHLAEPASFRIPKATYKMEVTSGFYICFTEPHQMPNWFYRTAMRLIFGFKFSRL